MLAEQGDMYESLPPFKQNTTSSKSLFPPVEATLFPLQSDLAL